MIFKKIKVKRFILGNSSRKDEPNGAWVNATGTLTPISWHQGRFFIQLNFGDYVGPYRDYNVIWLDEDAAIEYDIYICDY